MSKIVQASLLMHYGATLGLFQNRQILEKTIFAIFIIAVYEALWYPASEMTLP